MKRIFTLILALLMILPLASCAASLATEETKEEPTKTEEKTSSEETKGKTGEEEPLPTGEIVYPEGFSVGYNRQDISPTEFPIVSYAQFDRTAKSVHDPIQLTVVALCDGENAALVCTVDMRGCPDSFASYCATLVEREVGIPKERFLLCATHTHSSVEQKLFGQDAVIKKWQAAFYKKLIRAVTLALHDLTPAEAYTGTAHTEGITFVRRYLMDDGSYRGIDTQANGRQHVAHETEADTELRTVRFARSGKKDVLMVNYQTHYGSVGGLYPDSVSADFVHWLREDVEDQMDCHFAYIQGAAGNLNFQSVIPGERKYPTFIDAIPALIEDIRDAIAVEKELATGTIYGDMVDYEGKAWDYETNSITGKREINLRAVGFGDLGFVGAPYEMFDITGQQIRASSPYAMTFISAYTGGRNGYVPHAEGYEHGAYEAQWGCMVAPGSGEEFAGELLRLLGECKNRG